MRGDNDETSETHYSDLRNPYPGRLGVIEEGAYGDIVLVNGNPLEDISILTKPQENLALIMKDGKIYKDLINASNQTARLEARQNP